MYLNQEHLLFLIHQIIHAFFPVAVRIEIGDNYGHPIPGAHIRRTDNGRRNLRLIRKLRLIQRIHRTEKSVFSNDGTERIFRPVPPDEVIGHLIHVMDGKVADCRRNSNGVCALPGVHFSHRSGAVQINLHVHLPLIGKQLDKVFLKTAVQIPVDPADIVAQHILPVIRKLHGLSVGAHQMLAAEESAEILAQIKRKCLQPAEKLVV